MTRDDLESVIWQHGVRRAADMQAILLAADAYAGRQHRPRAVHLDDPGGTGHQRPACRVPVRYHKPLVTSYPGDVTCHMCWRTAAYGATTTGGTA